MSHEMMDIYNLISFFSRLQDWNKSLFKEVLKSSMFYSKRF